MDDFASLMAGQGVRRIGDKPAQAGARRRQRSASVPPALTPEPVSAPEPIAAAPAQQPPEAPAPVAWHTGRDTVATVQRALTRVLVEGGSVNLMLRLHGRLELQGTQRFATVGELAAKADQMQAELVVIDGKGWKVIMHPATGVATLTENPGEDDR